MVEDIADELPEEPDVETYEHNATDPEDGSEIQFTFEADPDRGSIRWTAEWDGGENSGHANELSDEHGAIIYRGSPRINGEKTHGSKLPDEKLNALEEDLEAVQEYRKEKREAEEEALLAQDLTLIVSEIEYKAGHRTKYTVVARVLKPSKDERYWDEDEQKLMDAMRRELGESNDYPSAESDEDEAENPFESLEEGTTLTVGEAASTVDGLEDTIEEIDAEIEREEAWTNLVDDYPQLRGSDADPARVREGFEEASDLGENVEVASGTASCNDAEEECSLDLLTYYATPDGDIDVARTHTY